MPTVRDLRDRIRSLRNTQQITKAMKQVAAAKIRRAELAQKQARPYDQTLRELLHALIASAGTVDHPFMRPGRAGAPPAILLITADKGLAGAFNSNIIRAADPLREKQPQTIFYTVGIKGRNAVRRLGFRDHPTWPLVAGSKIDTARAVARRITDDFIGGAVSEVNLVAAHFVSMMQQKARVRRLIPIVAAEVDEDGESKESASKGAVEFAPSPEFVLARLLPKYLEFTIFAAMLETDAAFYAAQLLAMTNATDNAGKLIDGLTIEMNNARQAAITKELLEIVAGAEALA